MPSRKKAKGKARKAAKEAKAKEEESRAEVNVAVKQREEESLGAQMQWLIINAASPKLCRHGYLSLSAGEEKICEDFIHAFMSAFNTQEDAGQGLVTAFRVTKVEYPSVYSSKLDIVISMLLYNGTQKILEQDNSKAQGYASLANFFEEFMAVKVHKTQATLNGSKVVELESADDHTLVSYYRKRIPCACLDKKYKEVKSVKKMGWCYNPNCSHPDGRVERSKMFSCTRCGEANYCSVECQRNDWKDHKKFCDENAKLKAAFDYEQP